MSMLEGRSILEIIDLTSIWFGFLETQKNRTKYYTEKNIALYYVVKTVQLPNTLEVVWTENYGDTSKYE